MTIERIAIDSNILVRILIDDPGQTEQVNLARQLLKTVRQVYVPQVVQVECVWVLQRTYHIPKLKLIEILEQVYQSRVFVLQHEESFIKALARFRHGNVGFSDYLILCETQSIEGMELYTFDKRLGKIQGCQWLADSSSRD